MAAAPGDGAQPCMRAGHEMGAWQLSLLLLLTVFHEQPPEPRLGLESDLAAFLHRAPGSHIPSMSFASLCLARCLPLKHCKGELINSDHS